MVAPSETQIVQAVKAKLESGLTSTSDVVREDEVRRLLATLELEHDWQDIAVKKFISILCKHSLMPVSKPNDGCTSRSTSCPGGKKKKKSKTDTSIPKSFIDPTISFPAGIRGVYFDPVKGKGLVATRSFSKGDLLFTEDAYIPTPPPEAFDQMASGQLCAQCFLPISSAPVALAIKNCSKCKHRFCTTACYKTAMATHHTLLCTGINASAKPLIELIERQKWQSLHCVARSLARLLMTLTRQYHGQANKKADTQDSVATYGDFETVYARLSSFATVSELERRSRNPGWTTEKASFESILVEAHMALCNALDPYSSTRNANLEPFHVSADYLDSTRKPLIKDLFCLATFMKLVGRANINMEKFGGLYSLHSFLNHSCSPNLEIRHVPERAILSSMKVAAIALCDIHPDDELVISYIDPNTSLARRQLLLYRDYCFGPCTCDKCTTQLGALGLVYDPAKHAVKAFLDSVAHKTRPDPDHTLPPTSQDSTLEDQLRASLGF